ncbi:hypothetical protein ABPG75_003180 [Micractinium tetrahymenae]
MLLSTPLGASVAPSSAQKASAALAPCRVAGSLRRGVVGTARTALERGQPARRRVPAVQATVQALQDTYNAEGSRSVAVTFTLSRKVDYGQQVLLVGDAPQLGSWELGRAPHMSWSEGDTWTVTVDLPEGAAVEYKFVLQNPGHAPVWEKCDNRRITVDAGSTGTLECEWDVVEARAYPPENSPYAYAPSDSSLANGHAAAAAALSAATAALEQKDRAAALAAVQEAAAAASAVVAAAEATAAAVAKAVQAAEALVAELDGPGVAALGNGAAFKGAGAAHAAAASTAQAASDARYSAEQLDFMRRKLDAIQSLPAVRNGSAVRSSSPRPASPSSRPASPAPAAPAANGTFTPEQLAFLQRKRSASQSPAPSSPPPRPRSSSPAPVQRSSPPPPPRAASPAQRPRSSSPAPQVSAVYAKDVSKYSPEQLEFLRRSGKL